MDSLMEKLFLVNITKSARTVIALTIIAILFSLSACIPVEDESVNEDLFKSKDDLKTIATSLTPGMTEQEVMDIINIPIEKFTFMSTEELQRSIYGNSMVQGSPYELEKFKQKLLTYKGYYLPYRSIKFKGSVGLGKMKVNKTEHDLRFILLFEDGILLKASVDGSLDINQHEDRYMWNSLIQKGAGMAF